MESATELRIPNSVRVATSLGFRLPAVNRWHYSRFQKYVLNVSEKVNVQSYLLCIHTQSCLLW